LDNSESKRFVLTADGGINSLLIVWDMQAPDSNQEATPVKMFSAGHDDTGFRAAVFSSSGRYIYTLGNGSLSVKTLIV
jgi:hypothetical protein